MTHAHADDFVWPSDGAVRSDASGAPRARAKARADTSKTIEYKLIFAVSFLVLLVAAVVEKLMPWTWFKARGANGQRLSVIGKAWDAAQTCTAYAFMG